VATAKEERWDLFIDESGSFDDLDSDVVVGGLLVRAATHTTRALREALQQAAPGLPWPIHHRWLGQPAWMACLASLKPEAFPWQSLQAPRHHLQSAWAALRSKRPGQTNAVEAALQAGRDDRELFQQVQALRVHIEQAAPNAARQLAREQRAAIARAIAAVTATEQVIVVAGETERADAAGAADRYLAVLEALLQRAAARVKRSVSARQTRAVVFVHVLGRLVHDPVLGKRTPLHFRHLQPLRGLPGPLVRLTGATVPEFDADVHPLLVAADFIANRSLGPAGSHRSLPAVEQQIHKATGATVRDGDPPRSLLCATGGALRLERGGVYTPTAHTRPWAVEQAREWREAP
jgi:hypothetical protein